MSKPEFKWHIILGDGGQTVQDEPPTSGSVMYFVPSKYDAFPKIGYRAVPGLPWYRRLLRWLERMWR